MGLRVMFFVQLRSPKWLSRVQLRYEQAGFLLDLRDYPFIVSLAVSPLFKWQYRVSLLLLQGF